MFALRGLAVSFSVFAVVYTVLSVAVVLTWRIAHHWIQHHPARRLADLLFALRIFPLVSAAVITAAFTVPSFLLLEPRSIDEPLAGIPLTLGLFGAALGLLGLANSIWAIVRASRTVSSWTREAQSAGVSGSIPVLRIRRSAPAMTAAGVLRPRVLLSESAEFVLNSGEMHAALNHELAHIHRRDNLKKLMMRFVAFPGMRSLESAWVDATELAADDAAVSNTGEALDLAAALIKLSRITPTEPPADLTAALVHAPASLVNARVERLIAWSDSPIPTATISIRYGLAAAGLMILTFAAIYSQALAGVHTATEWLMR